MNTHTQTHTHTHTQHNTTQHNTTQHNTTQHNTINTHTTQHNTINTHNTTHTCTHTHSLTHALPFSHPPSRHLHCAQASLADSPIVQDGGWVKHVCEQLVNAVLRSESRAIVTTKVGEHEASGTQEQGVIRVV